MEMLDGSELLLEVVEEPEGERNHPVLFAFAIADRDQFPLEVDILDAESTAFHEPHACAVHQTAEHLHGAGREVLEQLSHFVEAENDGDALGPFGSDGFDFELRSQDVSEEKEQGGEGLVLGAGSDVAFDGEVGEEVVDLVVSHFRGMHPAAGFSPLEAEKAFHPIDVSPFGANR